MLSDEQVALFDKAAHLWYTSIIDMLYSHVIYKVVYVGASFETLTSLFAIISHLQYYEVESFLEDLFQSFWSNEAALPSFFNSGLNSDFQ